MVPDHEISALTQTFRSYTESLQGRRTNDEFLETETMKAKLVSADATISKGTSYFD